VTIVATDRLTMAESFRHATGERRPSRRLTLQETLEIESDRRRRVTEAFLQGAEARLDRPSLRPWRGLAGGVALTVAIIVVVGVVGVARATLAANTASAPSRPSPAPTVSAASPARAVGGDPAPRSDPAPGASGMAPPPALFASPSRGPAASAAAGQSEDAFGQDVPEHFGSARFDGVAA
jgi:hypothetical protein